MSEDVTFQSFGAVFFLGAFAKLRKTTVSFMSVRPSVCPHGTTQLPRTDSHEI